MTYKRAMKADQHVIETEWAYTFALRIYVPREVEDAHPLVMTISTVFGTGR